MAREIQFDPEAPGMGLYLGTSSTDYTFPPRSGVELMGVVTEDNIGNLNARELAQALARRPHHRPGFELSG